MSTLAEGKKMGLVMATVLVTVNMVGTGIFLIPVSMASVGSISIWGWLVASLGAGALGLVFALLGAMNPLPGGPYAYARQTFGAYLGFQTNYVYWSANLVGNIAVATTVTAYFTELIPALKGPIISPAFTVGIIWVATFVNIIGPRCVGFISTFSTITALVPLFLIAIFGWFWFDPKIFLDGWQIKDESGFAAVSQSATFALWAFMGIESASVSAGVIRDAKRNVPLATIFGLIIATVLYVSTCTILLGVIPAKELATSPAPFATAMAVAIGPAAAVVIALCAILKAGSSLIGWTLTISQSAQAAAGDRLFPRVFGRVESSGIPIWNFLITGCIMSAIVVITSAGSLVEQFNNLIDIAIILTLLPYLYSTVAFLSTCWHRNYAGWKFYGTVGIALVAAIYCFWAIVGSEPTLVQNAMLLLFLSVPLYALILRGQPQTEL